MSTTKKKLSTYTDIPCPFCSLLCDDLVINRYDDDTLTVERNGCQRAIQHFEHIEAELTPRVNGKKVPLEKALDHAVKTLRRSSHPLIGGMGTDVGGARAAVRLAERTGAIIDHMYGDAMIRNIRVLQDHGWIMTTMAEIRNRADLVIFAGTNAVTNYPRFHQRVFADANPLFIKKGVKRELIYVGSAETAKTPAGFKSQAFPCKKEQIGEVMATVHSLVVGNQLRASSVAGIKVSDLQSLAQKMKTATYGVLVWAPGELDFPHAELTIQSFSELIKYLNRSTRFAGFSVGGNDGGASFINACSWLTGYPLRVSFSKGFPEYDPYRYSASNVLTKHEVDSLVWISSISDAVKPPKADIPTIMLACHDPQPNYKPEVFIPTAIPGRDCGGQLFRTDSVVSLCMKQLRKCAYPSTSEIIDRIMINL